MANFDGGLCNLPTLTGRYTGHISDVLEVHCDVTANVTQMYNRLENARPSPAVGCVAATTEFLHET
jgi:hypothetical protein